MSFAVAKGVDAPVVLADLAAPVSKGAFVVGDGPGNSPEEVILGTDKILFGDPAPATGVSQATLTAFMRTVLDDPDAATALATLGGLGVTDIDTLAELNAILTDAELIDTGDSRLSDARTPLAHNQAASTITAGTFDPGAFSFAGSTIPALDLLIVDNLSLNGNTITTTSGDLIFDATGGILAKTSVMLDGLGATDKDLVFDRADTTTIQGFRFRIAGAERWTLQQAVGTEELTLSNSNSTADFRVTPLGSVIHEGKVNGTVVSIDRGSDGHTGDLWQAQTFAEVVVASMSIAGKQTVKSLEVEDGPIIWSNGTEQDWHLLTSTSVINEDYMLQAQGAGRSATVTIYTFDGDGTDNLMFRVLSNATPDSIGNREAFSMGFFASTDRFEIFSNASGTGAFKEVALYVAPDTDQLILQLDNTIDSQGVQIINSSGSHVGTWAGTAVAVAFGGTGATTAAGARTNLGLVIGTDVQADLDLVSQVDAEAGTATDERVWSALRVAQAIAALGLAKNFTFAYDTTTQAIAVANAFQGLDLATNANLDGWTHVAGTSIFGCNETQPYEVSVAVTAEKSAGAAATFGFRALFNGVEVAGSMVGDDITTNNAAKTISKTFFVDGVTGQNLEIEVVGSSTNISVLPGPDPGGATTDVSATVTIKRVP